MLEFISQILFRSLEATKRNGAEARHGTRDLQGAPVLRGDVLRGEVNVIRSLAASCGMRFASYDEDRIGNRSNGNGSLGSGRTSHIRGLCRLPPHGANPHSE
jgi:hypothetical protein